MSHSEESEENYMYLLRKPIFSPREGGVSPPFDLLDHVPPRGMEANWRECWKEARCSFPLSE